MGINNELGKRIRYKIRDFFIEEYWRLIDNNISVSIGNGVYRSFGWDTRPNIERNPLEHVANEIRRIQG